MTIANRPRHRTDIFTGMVLEVGLGKDDPENLIRSLTRLVSNIDNKYHSPLARDRRPEDDIEKSREEQNFVNGVLRDSLPEEGITGIKYALRHPSGEGCMERIRNYAEAVCEGLATEEERRT